jgi:hypothetical protein
MQEVMEISDTPIQSTGQDKNNKPAGSWKNCSGKAGESGNDHKRTM